MIQDILAFASNRWGDKIAVVGTSRTYFEMYRRVLAGAAWMQHQQFPDDDGPLHVAMVCANSVAVMEWHYICAMTGAVVVNINPQWTKIKMEATLKRIGAHVVVYSQEFVHKLVDVTTTARVCVDAATDGSNVFNHADVVATQMPFQSRSVDPDAPFQLYFTSGTTGTPKSVSLSHRIVFQHALGAADEMRFEEADRWLHRSPMFHLVDVFAIFSITLRGGSHVFEQPGVTGVVAIERFRVTCFNCASTSMLLLAHSYQNEDLSSLRIISCGGSPLSTTDVQFVMTTFQPAEFFCSYGMTECCGKISMSLLPFGKRMAPQRHLALVASSGRPFTSMEVRIAGDGPIGEIQIRGPTVFDGYEGLDRADHFVDDWFRTGDLGRWGPEGYLTVVDRIKSMILVGGENVYPVEVEKVISAFPGVTLACVFSVPDALLTERAMAAITVDRVINLSDLRSHCAERLSSYERPKDFLVLPYLAKTASGKLRSDVVRSSVLGRIPGCYSVDMMLTTAASTGSAATAFYTGAPLEGPGLSPLPTDEAKSALVLPLKGDTRVSCKESV